MANATLRYQEFRSQEGRRKKEEISPLLPLLPLLPYSPYSPCPLFPVPFLELNSKED
jgi:hypothetical protein